MARLEVYHRSWATSSDVEPNLSQIVDNYDSLCFQNDLQRSLAQSQRSRRYAFDRRETGTLGACTLGTKDLLLEIAPAVVAARFSQTPARFQRLAGYPCENARQCILFVVEHALAHVVVELYDSYSPSGKLLGFSELAALHFGHRPFPLKCSLGSSECLLNEKENDCYLLSKPPTVFFKLRENSCYIDAVLTVILNAQDPCWRSAIFKCDLAAADYESVAKAVALTSDQVLSVATRVLAHLRYAFQLMRGAPGAGRGGAHLDSSPVRSALLEMLPDLKSHDGSWLSFSTSALYDALADLFPRLQAHCPVALVDQHRTVRRRLRRFNLLQMWDFLDPLTQTEGTYENILWEQLEEPALVFQNGGLPAIKAFDSLEAELVVTDRETVLVSKARTFGETILGGRYRLMGVVTLVNDTHYVACVRTSAGWCYYDDSGPVFVLLNRLPDGTFHQTSARRPELFFYARDIRLNTLENAQS